MKVENNNEQVNGLSEEDQAEFSALGAALGLNEPEQDEQNSAEETENADETEETEEALTDNNDETDEESETDSEDSEEDKAAEEKSKSDKDQENESEDEELDFEEIVNESKANKAFAAMRTQNKTLSSLVLTLAKKTGLDTSDTDAALKHVQAQVEKLNATEKLPPHVQEQIEAQQRQLEEVKAERRKENTVKSLRELQSKFSLKSDELKSFVNGLAEADKHPFEKDVNVYNEYVTQNIDKLLEAAMEKGRLEEVKRQSKSGNSTRPSEKRSKDKNTGKKKIESIEDLSKFLGSK